MKLEVLSLEIFFLESAFPIDVKGKKAIASFKISPKDVDFYFSLTKIENCTCIDFRIETRPTSMLSFFGNEVKRRGEGKRILDISLSF